MCVCVCGREREVPTSLPSASFTMVLYLSHTGVLRPFFLSSGTRSISITCQPVRGVSRRADTHSLEQRRSCPKASVSPLLSAELGYHDLCSHQLASGTATGREGGGLPSALTSSGPCLAMAELGKLASASTAGRGGQWSAAGSGFNSSYIPISSPWPILARTESSWGDRMRGMPFRITISLLDPSSLVCSRAHLVHANYVRMRHIVSIKCTVVGLDRSLECCRMPERSQLMSSPRTERSCDLQIFRPWQ